MRASSPSTSSTLLTLLCLAQSGHASSNYDCTNAVDDRTHWNLGALKGEKSLSWAHPLNPTIRNTTFTFDVCDYLPTKGDRTCEQGTHIDDIIKSDGTLEDEMVSKVPIAGNDRMSSGHSLDSQWTRLKNSDSNADSGKHGVRLEMQGKKSEGLRQKAIIEFICIAKDGKEEKREDTIRYHDDSDDDDKKKKEKEGDGEDSDGDQAKFDEEHKGWLPLRKADDGAGGTVRFLSYRVEPSKRETARVLRLEWRTPHACEGASTDPALHPARAGWGFFAWLFALVFAGLLAYFAFFAWINYSRLGARGWDVLPHADAIRDLPYILADWGRKVVSTVQGGGRGGYSAV